MGELRGIALQRLQGGLNRRNPSTDGHVALIIMPTGDVALDAAIANSDKGLVLTSVSRAEELGLTSAASANGDAPFYEHITEFFRLAPEGTLYLYNNKTLAKVIAFLRNNEDIKGFAIVDAFDLETQDVHIDDYQTKVIDILFAENRLIDFGILGFNGFAMANAVDLTEMAGPQISCLVVGSGTSNVAAVGAYLGMIAARKVNENAGSVNILNKPITKRGTNDYPLSDNGLDLWLEPVLTGGATIHSLTAANIATLESYGYIFAASYQGYPGVFFSNSHTCTSVASDYSYIENNRVWNKAARAIRTALMPYVKGVVKKDPATGFIRSTTAAAWESIANKALERMMADDEISGGAVKIDTRQVVNSDNPVAVQAAVVADGIVHEFEVALGLTNSIN